MLEQLLPLAHPLELSTWAAQRIYEDPDKKWREANTVALLSSDFYKRCGMLERDPLKARFLVARAVGRATVGPILYEIENDIMDTVQNAMWHNDDSLPMPDLGTPQIDSYHLSIVDRIYGIYGSFSPAESEFLQVSATYSYPAFLRFMNRARQGGRSKALLRAMEASLDELHEATTEYFRVAPKGVTVSPNNPFLYLAMLTLGANVTALNILKPAGAHAHLWPQNIHSEIQGPIRSRLKELAKPQNLTRPVLDAAFPQQTAGAKPPWRCPFAHGKKISPEGGVWDHPLLGLDDLDERWCPANIPFVRRDRRYLPATTAATKRLKTASYIADNVLWPGVVPHGTGVLGAIQKITDDLQKENPSFV